MRIRGISGVTLVPRLGKIRIVHARDTFSKAAGLAALRLAR